MSGSPCRLKLSNLLCLNWSMISLNSISGSHQSHPHQLHQWHPGYHMSSVLSLSSWFESWAAVLSEVEVVTSEMRSTISGLDSVSTTKQFMRRSFLGGGGPSVATSTTGSSTIEVAFTGPAWETWAIICLTIELWWTSQICFDCPKSWQVMKSVLLGLFQQVLALNFHTCNLLIGAGWLQSKNQSKFTWGCTSI